MSVTVVNKTINRWRQKIFHDTCVLYNVHCATTRGSRNLPRLMKSTRLASSLVRAPNPWSRGHESPGMAELGMLNNNVEVLWSGLLKGDNITQ